MKSLHRIIYAAAVLLAASLNAFSQTPGNDKVHVKTYVESFNYETMTGTVAIESFVEKDIKDPSASVTPMDIVIVIDASSSMTGDVEFPPYTYTAVGSSTTSYTYKAYNNKWYYYYKDGDKYYLVHKYHGSKYSLRYLDDNGTVHYLTGTGSSTTESGASSNTGSIYTGVLYTQTGAYNKTRLQLVKEAASKFVDIVYENSSSTVDNKIALVTFHSTANDLTNGFVSMTGSSNVSSLKTLINNIGYDNDTGTNLGMQKAYNYINGLSSADRTNREQVVVVFSDGEPTPLSGDDATSHENAAIATSKSIKALGAKVYSVGLLNGLYTVQHFMEYMSSNYANAANMSSPGSQTSTDYFFNDPTGSSLVDIFEKIAESIVPPKLLFGTDTEVQCEISSTLTLDLPSGGTSDIKAYTANCTGVSGGVFSFDTQIPLSGLTVTVNSNGITTNGFDYSENWCGEKNSSAHGKELILKIPFKFTPTALTDKLENIYASGKTPAMYKDADLYALATAPAAPEFVQLKINKSGLHAGESAIFEIDRDPIGSETAAVHVNRIVLTGTADDGTTVSHTVYFLNPNATYSVTEHTDWSWTYKPTETPQANGFIKLSKNMTTVPDGETATLNFVNTKYGSSKLPSNAETVGKY